MENIIYIVGRAASGKSYISEKFRTKGYFIISTDEIIRKKLIKNNPVRAFDIYNENLVNNIELQQTRKQFVDIIKKLIKTKKRVVIEGQLNKDLIDEIKGDNKFTIIFVKPKNKLSYQKHIINRFIQDPLNYGRIGWMKYFDEQNNNEGLKDYKKNGIKGKLIKKLIKKSVEDKYYKHKQVYDYYKKLYNNIIIVKT